MKLFIPFLFFLLLGIDASAGGWIQRASFGDVGRHRLTGFSIGNKGYVGLGHFNGTGTNIIFKDWWEYDPATNAWTQKADYIGNNGNGNYGVISFGLDSLGFIGGGQINTSPEFYRFDPIQNVWSAAASCPTAPSNLYGFSVGNNGYYKHGYDLYQYDPDLDQWTTMATSSFYTGSWSSAFEIDGMAYIKSSHDLWKFDPVLQTWEQKATCPGTAVSASVSFAHMGKGYIVAGFQGAWSAVVSEVCEYDPTTDSWVLLEDFPGTNRRFATGFTIGNRSYFGLGTNGTNFNDWWEFTGVIGMDETDLESDFSLYPNPATNYVKIKNDKAQEFSAILMNSTGQVIQTASTSSGELKMERNQLPAGNYFITITTAKGNHYSKTITFN